MAAAPAARWAPTSLAFILLILASYRPSDRTASAKLVVGSLKTGENWAFVSRFCFLSLHGRFQYEVEYEEHFGVQNIDLYYDTPEQWERVYGENGDLKTCAEKEAVLQVENNQFINLTTAMVISGCTRRTLNRTGAAARITCKGTRNFNTARERWWFVAVSNCNSTKGLQLRYRLLMTNGRKGDLLHYHFSADEMYILPILIVAFIQHFFLTFLTIWSAVLLRQRQLLHATYKLFMLSVFIHSVGVFLLTFHYTVYAIDGRGAESLKLNGRVCEACAEIIMLLLLILIAKGYTVTRARLRQQSAVKVAMFICCYCITYASLFVFEQMYFDPGQVLYLYESLAGYGLIILRTVGWCMFIYSNFFTMKHYPEKGGFYYPYFCFYTLWFIAAPTMIIISNHIIAEWVREKVVVSVEHFVTFLGHAVFLVLTRPGAHNDNFPYHVRTTQIGIMEAMAADNGLSNGSGALGPNTLDAFGHGGAYSVSGGANSNGTVAPPPPPRCLDIFTVDSVAAANNGSHLGLNRRNFAASPTPQSGSQSHQRGSAAAASAANAYAPPSYLAATADSRKQSGGPGPGPGREAIAVNGSTPKIYDPNDDDDGDLEENSYSQ